MNDIVIEIRKVLMIQAKPQAGAPSICHASLLSLASIVVLWQSSQGGSFSVGSPSCPGRLVASRIQLRRMSLRN